MKKRSIVGMALAAVMTVASVMPAFAAGWFFDGPESWQWKYVNDDGSVPKSTWLEVDGKKYHMDDNGYLDIGWKQIQSEQNDWGYSSWNWYHFDKTSGAMDTSGNTDTGYIGADGVFQTYYMNNTQATNEDDANVYWVQKAAQYGFNAVQGVATVDDGVNYKVYAFPVPNQSLGEPLDGQHITFLDYLEVASAWIGQVDQNQESWSGSWAYDSNAGVLNYYVRTF